MFVRTVTTSDRNSEERLPRGLAALVGVAVLVRFLLLVVRRPFWLDEVALVEPLRGTALVDLPFSGLQGQSAPLGFVVLVKIFGNVLGYSEFSLRLTPFLFSAASVVLSARIVLRAQTSTFFRLATLLAVSFAPPLLFYSQELKPYSADSFAVLLALHLTADRDPFDRRGSRWLWLFFLVPLLSTTGGLALAVLLAWQVTREAVVNRGAGVTGLWRPFQVSMSVLRPRLLLTAAALAIQLGYQVVALGSASGGLQEYWSNAGGFPGSVSVEYLRWLDQALANLWAYPFSTASRVWSSFEMPTWLGLAAFVLLLALGLRWRVRHVQLFVVITLTFLGLATLGLYPFHSRLVLFLVPLQLIALGSLGERLCERLRLEARFDALCQPLGPRVVVALKRAPTCLLLAGSFVVLATRSPSDLQTLKSVNSLSPIAEYNRDECLPDGQCSDRLLLIDAQTSTLLRWYSGVSQELEMGGMALAVSSGEADASTEKVVIFSAHSVGWVGEASSRFGDSGWVIEQDIWRPGFRLMVLDR